MNIRCSTGTFYLNLITKIEPFVIVPELRRNVEIKSAAFYLDPFVHFSHYTPSL